MEHLSYVLDTMAPESEFIFSYTSFKNSCKSLSIALMLANASKETVTMWVLKKGKHNPKD